MLTRKDYKAIASIIKNEYTRFDNTGEDDAETKLAIKYITSNLADYFTNDNPQFDYERFVKACLDN